MAAKIVTLAKARVQRTITNFRHENWMPAYASMTKQVRRVPLHTGSQELLNQVQDDAVTT